MLLFVSNDKIQEEPVDKSKHWGDLEEEEEEEEEEGEEDQINEDELEDGIQSVDSLSRYYSISILFLFRVVICCTAQNYQARCFGNLVFI